MTEQRDAILGPRPQAMALPFPRPGRRVLHAFHELDVALTGTAEQRRALGNPALLARPWDPPTCVDRDLRRELWQWLDEVVNWVNTEYVWDAGAMIPACWPRHPHLVHELAVLADLRRRAATALTSDSLEEWHRYALPAFLDRMAQRTKTYCADNHEPRPVQGRLVRNAEATGNRMANFRSDVATIADPAEPPKSVPQPGGARRSGTARTSLPSLHVVESSRFGAEAGEVVDDE
ncbi:hypothetical protein Cch01nite_40450 [Cellulomonas chitinilytica]|uniref:DUF4913 domain-containing protein n=1 Tax=Cellulomonas chitinilytica TaxID=398759 RepID=A0A919P4I1_9CELL|nr:hypothetical protein [Cellulomonas chitinilytica]GIG23321.1 hypothetical protein Cch01nite_40450 [Cellulomonas chitinilytica]